jgi:hypothetical protein
MAQITFDVSDDLLKRLDAHCDAKNATAGQRSHSRQTVALAALAAFLAPAPKPFARYSKPKPQPAEASHSDSPPDLAGSEVIHV